MVLLVAHEKGGVGKSTIATNMAIMRALVDREVLLVDADPQESAMEFSRVRVSEGHLPEISTICLTGRTLSKEISRMISRYDDIIIDCGGRDTATLRSAMMAADVLLVPFRPGQFDVWANEGLASIVEDAMAMQEFKVKLFLNMVDTNPKISDADEAAAMMKELVASHPYMELLETRAGYRVAYRRASAEGQAVIELTRTDPKASREMTLLYKEVFDNEA